MPGSPIDLLDAAESLGILTSSRTSDFRAAWTTDETLTTEAAAEQLVGHGLITAYQSRQLIAGAGASLVIAERYRIEDLLGAGGMGTVLLATDTQLDRSVAVKILPPRLIHDADAVARFEREAKALARLAHPNIVQAYDAGSDGAQHFLVMEHIPGTNLGRLLKEQGALGPATAADYAYQTAVGLHHAHQKGLVHRDLKPSNLLVTADTRVKILDLGLARFLQDQVEDETLTVEGAGLGTPDYMAPEQFGGARHADARSDVYALGCTLYHMLTGRVPFPGSSLSEKNRAHRETEPEAIDRLARGIPAGLAQVVRKMMAKRVADRFQSARECAEALLPYVDASSRSLPNLESTTGWDGSQLTIYPSAARRRRNMARAAIAAAMIVFSVGLSFGLSLLWNLESPDSVRDPSADADSPAPGSGEISGTVSRDIDSHILTVAQDGSGQYKSIGEALENVRPGMTIRVLDDGEYREIVSIVSASQHSGITLEAVGGATIVGAAQKSIAIRVSAARDVTVRGFRLRADAPQLLLVDVSGSAPGLLLENLLLEPGRGTDYDGMLLRSLNHDQGSPVIVQNCVFRQPKIGIGVVGLAMDFKTPQDCAGVILRKNTFLGAVGNGIKINGSVQRVHVVENQLRGDAAYGAIQLDNLTESAGDLLVANNTFFECHVAIRIWDDKPEKGGIRIVNNLILGATRPDFVFLDSGGSVSDATAGDGNLVLKEWQVACNWRETTRPTGMDIESRSWVPPGESNRLEESIQLLSRDVSSADFLRPAADSPLATSGAGATVPSLPSYVGAVPPEGADSWDWNRTWQIPPETTQLLTVSKETADGGQYRTINEALRAARPWATIRVLDDAVYEESLSLGDSRHEGISLEAPNRATLLFPPATQTLVTVHHAPFVRFTGFRLRYDGETGLVTFISLNGRCPGVLLDGIEIRSERPTYSVRINVTVAPHEAPVVMRRCLVQNPGEGIHIAGASAESTAPYGGVIIRDCRIIGSRYRGILVMGSVFRVLVAGNVVTQCRSAMQTEDLSAAARHILFANNTAIDNAEGFRYWLNASPPESVSADQMELAANVLVQNTNADMACFSPNGSVPEFAEILVSSWRFRNNWRDGGGTDVTALLPPVEGELKQESPPFLSVDLMHEDFIRPEPGSSLAMGGPGGDLPTYLGAVAPVGIEAWDWEITWRSRSMRAQYLDETHSAEDEQP